MYHLMGLVRHAPTATSFTCDAWWSGNDHLVPVRLEGHDADDKIAYVIRTQKTFWEIDQLEYIAMVGPSGGIYLDVGSNIGNHAVFFGRFCADHVVAIEPNPLLHPILRRNIDANALGERTTVVPVGISDTDAVGAMGLRDEHGGNIGASHVVPGAAAAAAAAGQPVELRRLDDLLVELASELPPLPITFFKIDVEGMEMGVLRSATTLLREHRPQIFVELITDDALESATSLLREFGYTSVNSLGNPPSHHFIVPGRHVLRDNKWHGGSHHSHSVHVVEEQLAAVTSPDAVVIVADLEGGGFGKEIAGRARLPFVEKNGQYFGPPADDAHAIGEITRLRAAGATHFALLWPAFWFFDTYPLFERHLRGRHRCVLENTRAIVFELR
jgi:FkbM family methyltransferase